MSQSRVNLATARRELAERQDEVNLFTTELKAAQEVMAAGGTGPKTLTVSERDVRCLSLPGLCDDSVCNHTIICIGLWCRLGGDYYVLVAPSLHATRFLSDSSMFAFLVGVGPSVMDVVRYDKVRPPAPGRTMTFACMPWVRRCALWLQSSVEAAMLRTY